MANHFSPTAVDKAIARLPRLSTKDVQLMRGRGEDKGLTDLVEACDAELEKRPIEYDDDTAAAMIAAEKTVAEFDLAKATMYAFSEFRQASAEERRILGWIGANPGGSYADALKSYGKGDLALAIGHLVYDRYGCFRRFVEGHEDQSSVLIEKVRGDGSVRYTIRPEVLPVFKELALI
ncbi:hypothetical protein [Fulvimarina sp. MAC8]|uniref:hypothetical protein n=1 Tax=Fulvimarina sp. MAC8 TaxID=3162874 RepID=UPI0032ECE9B7